MSVKRRKLANQLTQLINRNIEDELKDNLQNFFETLKGRVLDAFDEYYSDTLFLKGQLDLILAPIHEAHQEYYNLLMDKNLEMFHRGELQAERLTPKGALKATKPISFQHEKDKYTTHFGTLEFSEDYLQEYTFTASEVTMQRVDREINRILTDGYREGWGVKDVRNRIMERYDQFKGWEANRIARTEMQTAHNMGMMNRYQELNVEYVEWRSAHDKRTRRSHSLLDGEIIRLGDKFSNGLRYPGDKSGPIEEWINCRCSTVPYLLPPGTRAPTGRAQFRDNEVWGMKEPNYDELLLKETGGRLNWRQYQQILQGKTLAEIGILSRQKQSHDDENMVKAEGLESLETFKETIKTENKKVYNQLKRHNCFEEVYSILTEYDLIDFKLSEIQFGDAFKLFKKDELKEFIGMLDLDLYNEYYDKSFKKFCEHFGLESNSEILEAIANGISETGEQVGYVVNSEKNLILIIN